MGSLAAMKAGSAARYGHSNKDTTRKATAEGVSAQGSFRFSRSNLQQLAGGIQSGMGYLGATNLEALEPSPLHPPQPRWSARKQAHDVIEVKATRLKTARNYSCAAFRAQRALHIRVIGVT